MNSEHDSSFERDLQSPLFRAKVSVGKDMRSGSYTETEPVTVPFKKPSFIHSTDCSEEEEESVFSETEKVVQLPSEPSRFWNLVDLYVEQILSEKEPALFKQAWKERQAETLQLKEELQIAKEVKDESTLLQKCELLGVKEDADKRLKGILDMVHRGEISINRITNLNSIILECDAEKEGMRGELEKLRLEKEELKKELEQQAKLIGTRKQEMKELHEQFGGVIMRELANKEKEMQEMWAEREKHMLDGFWKRLKEEMDKKDQQFEKLNQEIEALKLKNVTWVMQQSQMLDKIDKLEKDKERLEIQNIKLQQECLENQTKHTNLVVKRLTCLN